MKWNKLKYGGIFLLVLLGGVILFKFQSPGPKSSLFSPLNKNAVKNVTPTWEDHLESPQSLKFPHNYIYFENINGKKSRAITEINGWLLLEALLLTLNGEKISVELKEAINMWSTNQLNGWWPSSVMKSGRKYLKGQNSLVLCDDVDDSIWSWILFDHKPDDQQIAEFLPKKGMRGETIEELCQKYECNPQLIFRVWTNHEWHDDWDLIAAANAVSFFNSKSPHIINAIQETKLLINKLIRAGEYLNFFHYYEPKIEGIALLLFYQYYRNPFLDKETESLLLKAYNQNKNSLISSSLIARWGGGVEGDEDDWLGGYNLVTVNDKVSKLLVEVLDRKIPKN